MLAPRTGWSILVAVAALLLPACATPSRSGKAPEVAPAEGVVSAATGFASLPAAPGQRVARHPAVEPAPPPVVAAKPPDAVPVKAVAAPPPPPDAPLVAAVKALLDNKPEAASEHLKGLDRPNQELLTQLLPPVVALSQVGLGRAGPLDYGVLAAQLESPLKALSARANLGITKAVFCSSPSGFGQYRPMPERPVFPRGKIAEVYVEVRNVPSVPVKHPEFGEGFVTHLHTTLQLGDAAGNVVELSDASGRPAPAVQSVSEDFSRSPVRDYFKVFRFAVPQKSGRYALAVEFHDPETGRAVSRSLSFDVGGS